MDVIILVDMQVGLLDGPPKHDLHGVIQRINLLMAMVRKKSGKVIWVRHCGKTGDGFERHAKGWSFLPELLETETTWWSRKHLTIRLHEPRWPRYFHELGRIEFSSLVGRLIHVSMQLSDLPSQTTTTSLSWAMVTQ